MASQGTPGNAQARKQPSNPIFISPSKSGRGRGLAPPAADGADGDASGGEDDQAEAPVRQVARSCPPLKFQPPKAPRSRPRLPSCEPPPMELPPSPPVFTEVDVQKELARRAAGAAEKRAAAMPLSRSLRDYSWSYSMSLPHPSFAPSVQSVNEAPEPAEEPAEQKRPFSMQESTATIFSVMKGATPPAANARPPAAHAAAGTPSTSPPSASSSSRHQAAADADADHHERDLADELQFSFSLDPVEDSVLGAHEAAPSGGVGAPNRAPGRGGLGGRGAKPTYSGFR